MCLPETGRAAPDSIESLRRGLWISHLQRQPGTDHRALRRMILEHDSDQPLAPAGLAMPDLPVSWKQGLADLTQPDTADQSEAYWKQGIRAICADHPAYPARLLKTDSFPLVLYWLGSRPDVLDQADFLVTVIGTRTPTAYGQMVTRAITADLADAGVVIISGLARGIDALAHRTTLEHGGLTVAVVAHGVDQVYPPEHRGLMERIAENGLIVSEHPPGVKPLRQYFPARNRILSGLSDAVAIMEASRDSGTMITAGFAGDQNRDVFAVPGSILSKNSQGCNMLIREGAGILESAADLLRIRPWANRSTYQNHALCSPAKSKGTGKPGRSRCSLSNEDKAGLSLFAGHALSLDEIAGLSGKSVSQTAAWLTFQEINGLIQSDRGRYALTESGYSCI